MRTTFDDDLSCGPLPVVDAIVVGASAGGVEALLKIFRNLRPGFSLPILMVLHLPDDRRSQLAHVFQNRLAIPVKEADDKEDIVPGTLYVAPAGYHVSVESDFSLSLSQEDRVFYSRPSIDILFGSAADAYGPRLAGVLLTGANNDGAQGLLQIKKYGGFTVIQDPSQAQASTMPEAGLALHSPDYLLSLNDIGRLLVELERTAC
ncbi:chemotaxis protein CheB [Pseudomonas amygdali pv. tabaci str. ATCC 11528]|uniref:protein-glutamate methylesterase n=26 Tax=Pseudomonas syringae group TaxID=136849 RepID=A0A2K4WVB1_PSESX|nr:MULTISPECIES: chemotaxis protein CheB [Pseudomonas]EGH23419.1 protein-glutamate methylesterase CheB [Pseudomonas amygdali pv. mori str. 301020]KPW55664.1 Protein-glutamate methylesterase CheB [Pseudomonas syringae pv. broussonetiae]ARA81065.1 chemotaxis protein CheB [Pseudomonas amygdali pv. lachrymans]ARD12547.1 chemotaxis protein CheB [Pseudomonas savastanoi pv. savastanoi NCPPB 3335]AVB14787.1 chemotaxis protein CheB [Pseudomonas amygdali pv. morsprunorum]